METRIGVRESFILETQRVCCRCAGAAVARTAGCFAVHNVGEPKMKYVMCVLIALATGFLLPACSQPEPIPASGTERPEPEGVTIEAPETAAEASMPDAKLEAGAVDAPPSIDVATLALKIDPVCKMSLEEYPATASVEHEGKTYGFCSAVCEKKFKADPAGILARLEPAPPVPSPAPAE